MLNSSLALWLVFSIVVFWVVGVYNRLMRIRARSLDALGSFEKHVRVYRTLAFEHWNSLGVTAGLLERAPSQDPLPPLWAELMILLDGLEGATKSARAGVVSHEPLAAIDDLLLRLNEVWSNLCCEPDDLTGPVVPAALHLQWGDNTRRVESARSGFNQINALYNEAIGQFPASLLARALRLTPAGLL